ncbi:acyltransferase domain-containing protein [Streptomyces sp. 6N223]|uniref:acyltransferase domain-containing protein n=1 Tax=Streptomyces sp. 6N223 TaxID=3457412 RepID=UPI003FD04B59
MTDVRCGRRPTTRADEGDGGKVVFLLGGQGSQHFGMARILHDRDSVFRSTMLRLDELAAKRCGRSPLDYLYDPERGFADRCDDLLMTNLAIFMAEFSLARTLESRGVRPDLLVGSSLGEFIAVAVAGHATPDEVLDFLVELSHCLESTSPPGGMVAVLAELDRYREAVVPRSDIAIASINNTQHFIISADRVALDRAGRMMAAHGLLTQDLPVAYAFHSPVMEHSASGIHQLSAQLRLHLPADAATPIYSSRTASLVTEVSAETCWQVLRGPIRFTETVARIPHYARHRYVDLSPSSTLAAILRSSLPEAVTFPIITPFNAEIQNIERLTERLTEGAADHT